METHQNMEKSFDEAQSLEVIKSMIEVSKNKFKKDGILFIVWGWLMTYTGLHGFVGRKFAMTFQLKSLLNYLGYTLALAAVLFTAYYLIKQRKKVKTYVGISIRYVWISLLGCMVLVNLIQFNVLHEIKFELQHAIFMVLTAFSVVVTGGILRYRLIIIGGIVFGLLALLASYLNLELQLLVEAIAWAIAFVIPGHILYANRNK